MPSACHPPPLAHNMLGDAVGVELGLPLEMEVVEGQVGY